MKTFTKLFKLFFCKKKSMDQVIIIRKEKIGNAFGKYTESIIYRTRASMAYMLKKEVRMSVYLDLRDAIA